MISRLPQKTCFLGYYYWCCCCCYYYYCFFDSCRVEAGWCFSSIRGDDWTCRTEPKPLFLPNLPTAPLSVRRFDGRNESHPKEADDNDDDKGTVTRLSPWNTLRNVLTLSLVINLSTINVPAAAVFIHGENDDTPPILIMAPTTGGMDHRAATITGSITTSTTATHERLLQWQLGNGEVVLPNPLRFQNHVLVHPVLLGSGSGGAVFAVQSVDYASTTVLPSVASSTIPSQHWALKVSWRRSTESVIKECRILQLIQGVPNVEHCEGIQPYPSDPEQRVMILLQPVWDGTNSTPSAPVMRIEDITTRIGQERAVRELIRTWIRMLQAGVATIDVQPLIDPETGAVLFIDFTEAQQIGHSPTSLRETTSIGREQTPSLPTRPHSSEQPATDSKTLVVAFCNEITAMIPVDLYPVADAALKIELQSHIDHDTLPLEILDIVQNQAFVRTTS